LGRRKERTSVSKENHSNTSVKVLPPREGRSLWFAADLYTIKAAAEDTDGAFTLFELTAAARFGPPPHIHHREDETYYVLEGEFEFLDNDRVFTAGAGSFVYLPKGRLHMHKNAGETPARALVLNTPAGVEGFIEEGGEPATDPSSSSPPPPEAQDLEKLVAIAPKYGIEVPPPVAPG
jgi:mannose-6-phosphate isomerase-like protein (cupin superfamily)